MFRKALITAAAALAAAAIPAAPALASGPNSGGSAVGASVTVNESISINGLTGTVQFPATNPGGTASVQSAENYTVTTNDPLGYTLAISAGTGNAFTDGGSATIPNANLSIGENSGNGTPVGSFSAATETLDTKTAPGTFSYAENWALAIPAAQPAGAYSETFTYLATAS